MANELPEIVKRALVETVTNIGQLSKAELYQLNKYVRKGWLSKGKAGPFPMLKTVYACPGFDFEASRERHVEHALMLADLDEQYMVAKGYWKPRPQRTEQQATGAKEGEG